VREARKPESAKTTMLTARRPASIGAMHETSSERRLCWLQQEVGRIEVCPREGCAFWEPGGAVLEGRCAFDGLDVSGNHEQADVMLEVRRELESASSAEEQDRARRRFHELIEATDYQID
jgi:hypothetical protein